MIIVTGAVGFIGSALIAHLNAQGIRDIIAVDDFSRADKNKNLDDKTVARRISRQTLPEWLDQEQPEVRFVFHLGARTDTAEFDEALLRRLNVDYSKMLWQYCSKNQIPLVYASSAATYGGGEQGYDDNEEEISKLTPLNPYGRSKQEFDRWVLAQKETPPRWIGLKFFNVFGPNEYHKGRMASVVLHAFRQISETGHMKLFRSHHPDFKDGEQKRDFIYVKDVVRICDFFRTASAVRSGIYNVGTGRARTFLDLARAVFAALEKPESISFIDTPEDIRDKYQYFTEANTQKLRAAGYTRPFTSLEAGINEYVRDYLQPQNYW